MSETLRVLVTGSREFDDYITVCHEIGAVLKRQIANGDRRTVIVVHGGARGADAVAERAARAFGMATESHPADWMAECRRTCPARSHRRAGRNGESICPAAGNYRNAEMIALGAELCLAFYKQGAGNRGTDHCARQAEAAGIPVRRVTAE